MSVQPIPERSETLQAFIAEAPLERPHIAAFVERAAREAAPGSSVLDAGAGEAPYRELFRHCRYITSDWTESVHPGARRADVIAPIDRLPLGDASMDVVLCTQVLEHVADPEGALRELTRVLTPGGPLWVTVPFVGELHEEPHDYYRYTPYALQALCAHAGLVDVDVQPLTGYYTTLAQVARSCALATGVTTGRADVPRRLVAATLRGVAAVLPALDRLDRRRALPLGYGCRAVRPPQS